MQKTVLVCVRFRLIVERPDLHITTFFFKRTRVTSRWWTLNYTVDVVGRYPVRALTVSKIDTDSWTLLFCSRLEELGITVAVVMERWRHTEGQWTSKEVRPLQDMHVLSSRHSELERESQSGCCQKSKQTVDEQRKKTHIMSKTTQSGRSRWEWPQRESKSWWAWCIRLQLCAGAWASWRTNSVAQTHNRWKTTFCRLHHVFNVSDRLVRIGSV
jgi:hypothetical protein